MGSGWKYPESKISLFSSCSCLISSSFLCFSLFFFCISLFKSSSHLSDSTGEGCGADWAQNGHGGLHLLHLFTGDGVFMATMTLAMEEFCVTESAWWEVAISIAGGILYFDRSSALTSYFSSGTDMGVFPSLWGIGQDLVTNKFTEADKVEGQGVIAFAKLYIIGGVVVAVVTAAVGTRVIGALGSTKAFQLNSPSIVSYWTGDPCLLFFDPFVILILEGWFFWDDGVLGLLG